jgi:hypothetical protein
MPGMIARKPLYSVDALPVLQNRVYPTADEAAACPRGDLRLELDAECGVVRNAAFDASLVRYDRHYNNEQSHSAAFERHLAEVGEIVRRHLGTRRLFEVGCGKAAFLERLAAGGCEIGGCDPTYEGDNPAVIREFFSPALGVRRRQLVLRHVLEHVADPVAFLRLLGEANAGGTIYIEVPCLDWILARRAWFDLFYEHVNYFRLDDFSRLFGRLSLACRVFGGQYLAVVADLGSLREPAAIRELAAAEPEPSFPADLGPPPVESAAEEVIWGAASKGVIYALLRQRGGGKVAAAVDVNPAKQGGFLPASGVPILAPEEFFRRFPRGTTVRVMNGNYLAEVRATLGDGYPCEAIDDH